MPEKAGVRRSAAEKKAGADSSLALEREAGTGRLEMAKCRRQREDYQLIR